MAAEGGEDHQTLVQEVRNKRVVSQKTGESMVRIARFLKPLAENLNQAIPIPNTPLLSEIFPHSLQNWPLKVLFKGWNCPQRKWKQWVDQLALKYAPIWNQTGILDAIISSTYEVRCNPDVVLGLSEFWCPETNTFVFPWGEQTITLEDVMILGGFRVIGEAITCPIPEELVKFEKEMEKLRTQMGKSRAKKAGHSVWIKHFMEGESEFEHVGFLSLWLSRYVFPCLAQETIGKHVFPVAVFLSQGKPMALAPAVLASLYRDLRLLKEQAMDTKESISVSAPFQLLQLWAFEHFPNVVPNPPNPLQPGEPRVARWQKLSFKINLPLVRSALQLAENFQWRPYAANLGNWQHPSFYKETEQKLLNSSSLDLDLRSFFQCIKCCELVGVDCKEKYLPHRVAMQFGIDQDLPGDFSGFNFIDENVRFFVPSRLFKPGVSGRYMRWWNDMILNREVAIKDVLAEKRLEMISRASYGKANGDGEGEDFHGSVASTSPIKFRDIFPRKAISGHNTCDVPGEINSSSGDFLSELCFAALDCLYLNKNGSFDLVKRFFSGFRTLVFHNESNHITGCKQVLGGEVPVDKEAEMVEEKEESRNTESDTCVPKKGKKKEDRNLELSQPKRSGKLSHVSTISDSCDSSDDDHLPIATCFSLRYGDAKSVGSAHQDLSNNQSQNVSSLTSRIANENCQKRTTTKGILQEQVTKKPSNAGKSSDGPKSIVEGKTEVGCSVYEPIDTNEEAEDMRNPKKHKESPNGVAEEGKRRKAGESFGNPIYLDDYADINTSKFQKGGQDLVKRVAKLEKLLGVIPD